MARVYPSPFEAQLNPPDDRCKGAVVDVPAGGDVPTVDRTDHAVENERPEHCHQEHHRQHHRHDHRQHQHHRHHP